MVNIMKLNNDALVAIISIFRKGLLENKDVSELLRNLDLVVDSENKLSLNKESDDLWNK